MTKPTFPTERVTITVHEAADSHLKEPLLDVQLHLIRRKTAKWISGCVSKWPHQCICNIKSSLFLNNIKGKVKDLNAHTSAAKPRYCIKITDNCTT